MCRPGSRHPVSVSPRYSTGNVLGRDQRYLYLLLILLPRFLLARQFEVRIALNATSLLNAYDGDAILQILRSDAIPIPMMRDTSLLTFIVSSEK